MAIALGTLTSLVDGQLIGDPETICHGANPPGEVSAGQVTMLANPRDAQLLRDSPAAAVVCDQPLSPDVSVPQLIVKDPRQAFARIVTQFRPPVDTDVPDVGISPSAVIDPTAQVHATATVGDDVVIGANVRIMPGVVVMPRCQIGDHCLLHANVTLYEHTVLHSRVVIHAGTVIGAHGFGYQQEDGRHRPTAQLGYVEIESDVELGACVTIDRGSFGATRIGEGTKIDNQVMIGHNCQIGRHNLICSQVGIAGSCRTGDYVVLAGQVGLKDHITLGDQAIVGAQAGVMENLDGDQVYLGSPATSQRDQMQIMAVQRRLPEMRKELKSLRRELDQLRPTSRKVA
ncbi:MAG: UDP-3-O-(3-hydroxymyristoyl)glucosamine N-acyltransferase [Planctomycetota bacterium]